MLCEIIKTSVQRNESSRYRRKNESTRKTLVLDVGGGCQLLDLITEIIEGMKPKNCFTQKWRCEIGERRISAIHRLQVTSTDLGLRPFLLPKSTQSADRLAVQF
jgi:hypothetical protein